MAGDLEEFLKRAAERRAQKQGGAAKPAPQRQEAPRQRQEAAPQTQPPIRRSVEEPVLVAEVVEPVNPLAEQQRRVAEAKQKAEEARKKLIEQQRSLHKSSSVPVAPVAMPSGTPAEQLFDLIGRPGGLQQAFLMREILERPKFED